MRVNTTKDKVKRVENCGPHFGLCSKKSFDSRPKPVKMKPKSKHVKSTTENQKENPRSISPPFFLMVCFFLSGYLERLRFHTMFLSLDDYFKSLVANIILFQWNKTVFCACQFSHGMVTIASDYHLRRSYAAINTFARGGTTVHFVCNGTTSYLVQENYNHLFDTIIVYL